MAQVPTLWPDDGRRQRARELLGAARSEAENLPVEVPPYLILRELSELASNEPDFWALHQALASVERPTDDLVKAVERGIEGYVPHDAGEDPPCRHKYYIPLEMVLARDRTKPTQFFLLGKQIFLRSKQSVQADFEGDVDETLLVSPREWGQRTAPPTIATCSVTVPAGGTGWDDEISGPFHVLRGLLELVTTDLSFRSSVQSEPSATVPSPPLIAWSTDEERGRPAGGAELSVQDYRPARRHTFNQGHFDRIRSLSEPLTAPVDDDSTGALIAVALQLYARAMDAQFDSICFLALWQCLEALTLPRNRAGSTRDITRRGYWILRQDEEELPDIPETLKSMAKIRNGFVHTGREGYVDTEDVNVLKRIVDKTLAWYLESGVHEYEKSYDLEAQLLRIS